MSGCAVSFDKSEVKEIQGSPLSVIGPDCQVKYEVSVLREEYQKKDRINPTDYIDWTKDVLNENGCIGVLAAGEKPHPL